MILGNYLQTALHSQCGIYAKQNGIGTIFSRQFSFSSQISFAQCSLPICYLEQCNRLIWGCHTPHFRKKQSALNYLVAKNQTPWPESAIELYRPSDRRLSAKLVPTFSDRGCRMVSVMDPYGYIHGFLDQSRYFYFQVAPQLYSRG
jgi:hypothetical protein